MLVSPFILFSGRVRSRRTPDTFNLHRLQRWFVTLRREFFTTRGSWSRHCVLFAVHGEVGAWLRQSSSLGSGGTERETPVSIIIQTFGVGQKDYGKNVRPVVSIMFGEIHTTATPSTKTRVSPKEHHDSKDPSSVNANSTGSRFGLFVEVLGDIVATAIALSFCGIICSPIAKR